MAHEKDIDSSDGIIWANHGDFRLLSEVTQIQESELAISDEHAERSRILGWIFRGRRLRGAERV